MASAWKGPAREVDASTSDLLRHIVTDIEELIRSEVRLAKAEIKEEAIKAGRASAVLAAGSIWAFMRSGSYCCAVFTRSPL